MFEIDEQVRPQFINFTFEIILFLITIHFGLFFATKLSCIKIHFPIYYFKIDELYNTDKFLFQPKNQVLC